MHPKEVYAVYRPGADDDRPDAVPAYDLTLAEYQALAAEWRAWVDAHYAVHPAVRAAVQEDQDD